MKLLAAPLLVCLALVIQLVGSPGPAFAETPPSTTAPTTSDGRLVPVLRDGVFVGLKVYAIRPGGRFDQPTAKFQAGDTIEQIDGVAVTTDAGTLALHDKVIEGRGDATVSIKRAGKPVTLHSKAR